MHQAIAIVENSEQKPSHLTELYLLFSVLALLDASIGMIGLWFQCHDSSPVTTFLSKSGSSLNVVLNVVHATLFLQFSKI